MFSLIGAWANGWVNNWNAGDLRHHRAHYDIIVMINASHDHPDKAPQSIFNRKCSRTSIRNTIISIKLLPLIPGSNELESSFSSYNNYNFAVILFKTVSDYVSTHDETIWMTCCHSNVTKENVSIKCLAKRSRYMYQSKMCWMYKWAWKFVYVIFSENKWVKFHHMAILGYLYMLWSSVNRKIGTVPTTQPGDATILLSGYNHYALQMLLRSVKN